MAGDWIAWVCGLTTRREVVALAAALSVSTREAAAMCMEVWEWADRECDVCRESRDCHAPGVTLVTLDLIARRDGFGVAMRDVAKWVVETPDGLVFPRLGQWTGKSARERLLAATRQGASRRKSRTSRDEKRDESHAHGVTKSATRVEKSRDLGSSLPPDPSLEGSSSGDSDLVGGARAHSTFEFTAWFAAYPKRGRTGARAAAQAWHVAIADLVASGRVPDQEAAAGLLQQAAEEFAVSPKGQGQFVPAAATWLTEGRWDDDRIAWQDSGDKGRPRARGESYVERGPDAPPAVF